MHSNRDVTVVSFGEWIYLPRCRVCYLSILKVKYELVMWKIWLNRTRLWWCTNTPKTRKLPSLSRINGQ